MDLDKNYGETTRTPLGKQSSDPMMLIPPYRARTDIIGPNSHKNQSDRKTKLPQRLKYKGSYFWVLKNKNENYLLSGNSWFIRGYKKSVQRGTYNL